MNPDPWATCTGCGAGRKVSDLSSKYGKAQLLGEIKGLRMWEATCQTCNAKAKKGLQAIWKESP